ncbi:MAG: hypothetical protein JO368_10135 [Acidimicrobiales bacterium]|nr:hypothetical protein [Acidimicrobiales bacterium]
MTQRFIVVPGASEIFPPLLATHALPETASPTAGMPVPLVDAAVTVPVNTYSVLPFLHGPWPGDVVLTFPIVVVAPLLLHVTDPPVARLDEGALALL